MYVYVINVIIYMLYFSILKQQKDINSFYFKISKSSALYRNRNVFLIYAPKVLSAL